MIGVSGLLKNCYMRWTPRSTPQKRRAEIALEWQNRTSRNKRMLVPWFAKQPIRCAESWSLSFWGRLRHHVAHRGGGTWRAPLSPNFQALAGVLNIREEQGIFERRAPRGNDAVHAIPDHPDFAIAFEE